MFYHIVNVYSGPANFLYARVDYWAAAEDKFLGLPPILKNDFLTDIHCATQLVHQICRYGRRALEHCTTGDYTNHIPNHKHPISADLTALIHQHGSC
jgi:hypothetical protein